MLSLSLPAVSYLLDIVHPLFEQCGLPVYPAQGLRVGIQDLHYLRELHAKQTITATLETTPTHGSVVVVAASNPTHL